jgi:predicted 3-demethylubiquinone-9 3-methyltransferase (glyoxalase superfamily)
MNNQIYPCIWFDNNGNEAANFYCKVFANSAITAENNIVTTFQLNGQKFMALTAGPMFKPNPSISFFALFDAEKELDEAWQKISEGGFAMMPLDKYPWSEKYGWIQDRFGVSWQFMLSKPGVFEQKFTPALMFTKSMAGRAEEAMHFYTSLFPGSAIKDISRYEKGEPDVEGTVKHGRFVINNQLFIAMDSSMPHAFNFNEGVSLVVDCDTQDEIDFFWNKLTADGGQESMCGWLKDKYGVSWQIVPTILGKLMSDPERAPKVTAAFMQMKKFDIETLLNA